MNRALYSRWEERGGLVNGCPCSLGQIDRALMSSESTLIPISYHQASYAIVEWIECTNCI